MNGPVRGTYIRVRRNKRRAVYLAALPRPPSYPARQSYRPVDEGGFFFIFFFIFRLQRAIDLLRASHEVKYISSVLLDDDKYIR